jgi:hypothetical protein
MIINLQNLASKPWLIDIQICIDVHANLHWCQCKFALIAWKPALTLIHSALIRMQNCTGRMQFCTTDISYQCCEHSNHIEHSMLHCTTPNMVKPVYKDHLALLWLWFQYRLCSIMGEINLWGVFQWGFISFSSTSMWLKPPESAPEGTHWPGGRYRQALL